MSCPRFTPAVLFYRRALRPACARHCVSLAAYCPRFTPAVCLATNRTACGISRSCSARVEIAISTFSNPRAVIKLFRFTSGTSVSLWRSRQRTRERAGNGVGGAAEVRFCVNLLALPCFPPGVRWGCAPQTAPKSLRLSGLSSGAGRVRECALRGGVMLVRIRVIVIRAHG